MRKNSLKLFILAFSILLAQYSCNQFPMMPSAVFSKYVSAYTSGIISRKSPIVIELQEEYKGMERIGEVIHEELFEISPKVSGKAYLKGNNKIEFVPNEPLESDKEYKISFALSKALPNIPSEYSEMRYKVKTRAADYKVELNGMETMSKSSDRLFNLKGTVTTADYTENEKVEKALESEYEAHNSKILWNHKENGTVHEFTITHIEAQKEASSFEINISSSELGGTNKEEKVEIPSTQKLSLISIVINRKENNTLKLSFSKNIKSGDLNGLFYLGEDKTYKYEIDKNIVYLYPEQEIIGKTSVKIHKGIKATDGSQLESDVVKDIEFGSLKPNAEIIGKGNIIVGKESVNLPIKTIGLNAVKIEITKLYQNNVLYFLQNNSFDDAYQVSRYGKIVYSKTLKLNRKATFDATQWTNHNLDLKTLIDLDPGTLYKVQVKFDQSMAAIACPKGSSSLVSFLESDENNSSNNEEDEYSSYYPRGYNYDDKENPCTPSYYTKDRFAEKVILASNIGMIIKKGAGNKVFTTCIDMQTTEPMSGVQIDVFDAQLQPIGSKSTSSDGFADFECKGTPYIVIAKKGKERAYQRLQASEALPVDVFDVGGVGSKNGMKGFIYGERGVWRPGDKIFLTLVLDNKGEAIPAQLPVQFELANPSGQIYDQKVSTQGQNGFYAFETYTPKDAITGNWIARFKVGNSIYEKTIKIETIKPNRIKIQELGGSKELLTFNENLNYEAMWLTGTTAANLKATVDVTWNSAKPEFPSYQQYQFEDPTITFGGMTNTVFEGTTDASGKFNYKVAFEKDENQQLPTMLRASLITKVFENSGDFSIQYDTKKIFNYNSFVGLHFKDYTQDYYWYGLQCGKPYTIDLVNINANGKLLTSSDVTIKLIKTDYNFWYNSYNNSEYFSDANIKEIVSTQKVAMTGGIGHASITVPKDKWGKYLILIKDNVSGHTTGMFQYFDLPYDTKTDEEKESSTVLPLTMSKNSYNVGESGEVVLNSPFKGKALVSIENNHSVITRKFVVIHQGKNAIPISIQKEMSPNAYVTISLMQPHANTTNKLPIRMFGITPIHVQNTLSTTINPVLSTPAETRPESKFNVTVSEKNGKPMTYTLAVVDEGLLGVTAFKTPNPWNFFYSKEALGVSTWDMFDRVIGVFTGVFESMFSIGGDENVKNDAKEKVKRFDPVVTYLGPYTLQGGENKTHSIHVPNYMGSVKVMIVAGDGKGAFGTAESNVRVAQPLMLLTTFPRMVSPGEEIELPVNLFVTKPTIKNVEVKITPNEFIEVIGKNTNSLAFETPSDKIVSFKVKVKNKIGIAKIKIEAKSGEEKAYFNLDAEVRLPNAPTIKSEEFVILPGEKKTIPIKPLGIYSTRKTTLQISGYQNLNIQSKLEQLITYPYGCVEQTTSAAFPQLYLDRFSELSPAQKTAIDSNITRAIERLKGFQTATGGFSYWQNGQDDNQWGTIYATHFLWNAQKKGYVINNGMLKTKLEYVKKMATQPLQIDNDFSAQNIQAYRLYLLALAEQAELGSMNRLKELNISTSARIKLAIAYILSGKKEIGKQLLDPAKMNISKYFDGHTSYSSDVLDYCYLIEAHALLGDQLNVVKYSKVLTDKMNSNSFLGTQNTAMALRVLAEYTVTASSGITNFEAQCGKANYNGNGTKPLYEYTLGKDSCTMTITNKGTAPIYANLTYSGVQTGVAAVLPNSNLDLKVEYKDKQGNPVDITALKKQTEIIAYFTVTNKIQNRSIYNLAMSYLVPSGWEIVNQRMGSEGQLPQAIDNLDIRDDRIYYFFNLRAGGSIQFSQPLVASYEGSYYLPAIKCEAMYNPDVYGSISGKQIRVIK